jgi:hypothetical protein
MYYCSESQVAVRVSRTVLYCRPVVAGQRCADVWARFFRDEMMRDEMPVGARIGSKHGHCSMAVWLGASLMERCGLGLMTGIARAELIHCAGLT